MEIFETILSDLLEYYFSVDINTLLNKSAIKERVVTIRNMKIIIYPNDHNPPHFHVLSNDKKIDAKFTISDCTFLGGKIENTDLKRVNYFFDDPKTKIILEKIWSKYQHSNHNT